MNKWKFKVAKWLLHDDQFKFAAIKEKDGNVWIEGDVDLIRYTDTSGFLWKKEPLRRGLNSK